MRRSTVLNAVVIALIAIVVGLLVGNALASAETSPTASPSPSAAPTATPPPVVVPAPVSVVKWAMRWRRAAVRSWTTWNRARWCLSMRHVPFSSPRPRRSAPKARWLHAGSHWKHLQREYRARTGRLVAHMRSPGGSGWERWRPLVRWIWPARYVGTVIQIMRYESGGNPRVLCGGYVLPWGAGDGTPDARAGGLMQLKPAPRHWADPYYNLWYAFHKKFIPAGWSWSPWAGCRAF